MAPPDTIWHKESLKLKEIFGTREGFEICPNKFFHRLIKAPPCTKQSYLARGKGRGGGAGSSMPDVASPGDGGGGGQ